MKAFAVTADGGSATVDYGADEDLGAGEGDDEAKTIVIAVNAAGEAVGAAVEEESDDEEEEEEDQNPNAAARHLSEFKVVGVTAKDAVDNMEDTEGNAAVDEAVSAVATGAGESGEPEVEEESMLQQHLSEFKVVGVTAGDDAAAAAVGAAGAAEIKAVAVTAEGDSGEAETEEDVVATELKVVAVTAAGEAEVDGGTVEAGELAADRLNISILDSAAPESLALAPSADEVEQTHLSLLGPLLPGESLLSAPSTPSLDRTAFQESTHDVPTHEARHESTSDSLLLAPLLDQVVHQEPTHKASAHESAKLGATAAHHRPPESILVQTGMSLTKSSSQETAEVPVSVPMSTLLQKNAVDQAPPLTELSKLLQENAAVATAAFTQASSGELTTGLLFGFLLLFIVGMGIAGSMLFVDHPDVKTRSSAAHSRAAFDAAAAVDRSPMLSSDKSGNWTTSQEVDKPPRPSAGKPGNWTNPPEVFHLSPSPSGLAQWGITVPGKSGPLSRQASKAGGKEAMSRQGSRPGGGLESPIFGTGKLGKGALGDRWGPTVFGSGVVSASSSDAGSVPSSEAPAPPALPPAPPHYLDSAVKPLSQLSLRTTVPMPLRQLEQFAQMRFAERAVSPPFRRSMGQLGISQPSAAEAFGDAMIGAQDITVPQGAEVLLALPSLREVSSAIVSSLNCHIADDGGRFLFGVVVDRTPESSGGAGDLVMERISLVDWETRQVHGSCELCLPCGGNDVKLQASILSSNGSHRALVTEVSNLRGQRALLVGSPDGNSTQLIVQAHPFEKRAATISSQDRFFAGSVEPGSGSMPGGGSEFYWLRVGPGANTGLIILALLALDRLPASAGSGNTSAAGSLKSLGNPRAHAVAGPDAGPMYKFDRENVRPSRTSAFAGIASRPSAA